MHRAIAEVYGQLSNVYLSSSNANVHSSGSNVSACQAATRVATKAP
jgi:hypothetical protein